MEEIDNTLDDIYGNDSVNIHGESFDKDFDDIGWNPEIVDDSNEEAAKLYGL